MVQLPRRRVGSHVQRLQQEGADAGFGDGLGEGVICVAAGFQGGDIQPLHRVDQVGLGMGVGHRRNVCDDQFANGTAVGQCQLHRGLTAHRMANDISTPAMG